MKLDDYMALLRLAAPGVEVIPADDNGPRPKKTFCTARLTPAEFTSVHRGVVDAAGLRTNSMHRAASLQVQVFGADSLDVAQSIVMRLAEEQLIDTAAETYGIAWGGPPRVQDIPALMDEHTYESRAVLDADTTYTVSAQESVGVVETVEAALQTDLGPDDPSPSGWQTFTATIAVPEVP